MTVETHEPAQDPSPHDAYNVTPTPTGTVYVPTTAAPETSATSVVRPPSGELARTGADVEPLWGFASVALIIGAVFVIASRRMKQGERRADQRMKLAAAKLAHPSNPQWGEPGEFQ